MRSAPFSSEIRAGEPGQSSNVLGSPRPICPRAVFLVASLYLLLNFILEIFHLACAILQGMEKASLQFHIEANDYFGTLATVMDLVSQDLKKKGQRRSADTLRRQRDRLMYFQGGYRIAKVEADEQLSACREVGGGVCRSGLD